MFRTPTYYVLSFFTEGAEFVSVTYRLFKLPKDTKSEPREAIYEGDIRGAEEEFKFDHKYTFKVRHFVFLHVALNHNRA